MRQASLARYLFRSGANMDVRQIVMGDAPAVQAIYAPYVTDTTISFEEVPPDIVEVERRIAVVLPKYPYLVAEEDGRIVGYAYASEHRTRAAYRTRSEEHTSELQSLMRISYAVFCLNNKKNTVNHN